MPPRRPGWIKVQPKQKAQPPSTAVIARSEATWQSVLLPSPWGTGNATHYGGCGLPRRLSAPRNDGCCRNLVLLFRVGRLSVGGRRGPCRPPYGEKSFHPIRKSLKLCIIRPDICKKTFDRPGEMCYPNQVQGSDEDTPRRMMPREEPIWCDGSAFGNRRIPLLSRREEMPGWVRPLQRQ